MNFRTITGIFCIHPELFWSVDLEFGLNFITVSSNVNWTAGVLVIININWSHLHRPHGVRARAEHGVARVVEEPSECKLVEAVVEAVVVLVVDDLLVRPQLVRVDRVEVGGVLGELDVGFVRRGFLAQVAAEVDPLEEVVVLDLVRAVPAEPLLLAGAQGADEGLGLAAEARVTGDVQRLVPVDHLRSGHTLADVIFECIQSPKMRFMSDC